MHPRITTAWLGLGGQRRAVLVFGLVVSACWTSAPPPVQNQPVTIQPTAASEPEYLATVRIDAAPSGKKFQGVWLEHGPEKRWVIDYRPTEIWRSFENESVIVTGHCYEPRGQAINATHFKVATMRFARPPNRAVPYRSLGPEQLLRGAFTEHVWPAGTRRAGDVERQFRTDDGVTFGLADAGDQRTDPVAITARVLEPDPTYAATTGEPRLFVIAVHAHDHEPSPTPAGRPCP